VDVVAELSVRPGEATRRRWTSKQRADFMKSATATKAKENKGSKDSAAEKRKQSGKPMTRAERQAEKHKKQEGVKKDTARKKVARKQETAKLSWWQRAVQFVREAAYELRKVVWPSRKETIATTSVVLVVVLIAGVYLGLVDIVLSRLMRLVIG
jgi:preprotein translocase subunit SecE